jgi:Zn-dependent protease
MPINPINVILSLMIIGSFLLAIVLHESSHALMASALGDATPRSEGRQSLSLRTQLDALGTILCLILAFLPAAAGPVGLGWGKPVKTDPWKLRGGPNGGTLLVAIAGPISSMIIGLLVALLLRFAFSLALTSQISPPVLLWLVTHLLQLLTVFASVNICLALFNVLPFYPLDGYQIVYTLLPTRQAVQFAKSAPYGPFIILALFFLLPFLAQISGSGLSELFIFRIPYYLLAASLFLIALVTGQPLAVGTSYFLP